MRNRNFHKSLAIGTLLTLLVMQVLPAYAICGCQEPGERSCCTVEAPQQLADPEDDCCATESAELPVPHSQAKTHSHGASVIVHSGLVITSHDCNEIVVATDLADAILVAQVVKTLASSSVSMTHVPSAGLSLSQGVSLEAPREPPNLFDPPIYLWNATFLI